MCMCHIYKWKSENNLGSFFSPFTMFLLFCLLLYRPNQLVHDLSGILSLLSLLFIGGLRFQMHATVLELMRVLQSKLRSLCLHTELVPLGPSPSLLISSMQILESSLCIQHLIFSLGKQQNDEWHSSFNSDMVNYELSMMSVHINITCLEKNLSAWHY